MFWADEIAKELIEKNPENVISTGITPSGYIHVGNLREITVGDTLYRAIIKQGGKASLFWIADDFDRLRKIYPFLPADYEQYIGQPLSRIPDFKNDGHKSYAEHFITDFVGNLPKLGIKAEIILASQKYQAGVYTEKITLAIQEKEKIKKILETISNRVIEGDYSPYVPYCGSCGKDFTQIIEEDLANTRVKYTCKCGHEGWSDYSKGEGKLSWRVDWPARWGIFGVTAEPLGKDHAASGGSYDTAKVISEEIFKYPAPRKITYENIHLKGTKGKMSSSLGNVISATDALKIIPPSVVRAMLIRSKDRHLNLDPAEGLIGLIDEFTRLEEKVLNNQASEDEKSLYEYSNTLDKNIRSHIPFNHLVNVFQSAQGNMAESLRLLKRSNHIDDEDLIKEDLGRVKNWLDMYAPESIKFSLSSKLPNVANGLNPKQKELLGKVITCLDKEADPEKIHNFIYQTGKDLGLSPKESFEAVYLVLIGKKSGPKAGWFISQIDKSFVINRFKEAIGEK